MQEQEYEQRLQEVEGNAISALNEERKRGDEMGGQVESGSGIA